MRLFAFVLGLCASLSSIAQQVPTQAPTINSAPKPPEYRGYNVITCGVDTVAYPLAKATAVLGSTINVPSEFDGYGQWYEAPQPIEVSGFTFYAGIADTSQIVDSVVCTLWSANPDSTPNAVLATTTVIIPGNSYNIGSFSTVMERQAIFGTPITVTSAYLITIQTATTRPMGIVTSDHFANDGQGEDRAYWHWTGDNTWYQSQDFFAWDMDVIMHPHVSYDLEIGYDVDNDVICAGDSICLTDTTISPIVNSAVYNQYEFLNLQNLIVDRAWGDGTTGGISDTCHTYVTPGNYDLEVHLNQLTWTGVCRDTAQHSIVVGGNINASFSNSSTGLTVDFTDLSTDLLTSWFWDFGDSNASSLQNPQHTYAAPGFYDVCLIVTGCAMSDTFCMTIPVGCVQPIADFSSSVTALTSDFTDLTTDADTYFWDFGDSNTSTLSDPSHTYSQPGTYWVCLIASEACYADTFCDSVTVVCPALAADFSIFAHPDGQTYDFTDISVGNGSSWSWDFGDSNTSTDQNPQHVYASAGQYVVCLTVDDSCSTSTICDTISATVGIGESSLGNLLLFPNPVSDELNLHIQMLAGDWLTLEILDASGRLVHSEDLGTVKQLTHRVNLSDFSDGIYMVQLTGSNGRLTERIVKQAR